MADSFTFPVDLTSIMLFASAIGETNKIYYDEEYAGETPLGGVIAPPSYPIASAHWNPSHPLRGVRRIPEPPPPPPPDPSSKGPGAGGGKAGVGEGSLTRVLHGEQRFTWHKPMLPGMKLTVTGRPGKSWSKEGRRGGTMNFSEAITEYRDEGGELVCTATTVGIVTSKAVE